MDKKTKNTIQYVFWTAVALVLLWFCFRAVNWNEFLEALKVCKWGHMVTALLCGCLFVLFRSLRWHMLIRPIDPSITWVDVFNAYGIGYVVNLVLPRAGEVVKMGYVVKHSALDAENRHKFSWDGAIGTFVVERGVDAIVVGLMTLVFLWGMWDTLGSVMAQSMGQGSSALVWGTAGLIVGTFSVSVAVSGAKSGASLPVSARASALSVRWTGPGCSSFTRFLSGAATGWLALP